MADAKVKAAAPKKAKPNLKGLRPEVRAAHTQGAAPNRPNEGPATGEFRPPVRSPNSFNPSNEGPASPYRPPRRS